MASVIPPDFAQFVQQQLASGEYQSEEEVVTAGLQVLRELKRRQAEFCQEVQVGVEQLDRGQVIKLAPEDLRAFFDDIQARGQQRCDTRRRAGNELPT